MSASPFYKSKPTSFPSIAGDHGLEKTKMTPQNPKILDRILICITCLNGSHPPNDGRSRKISSSEVTSRSARNVLNVPPLPTTFLQTSNAASSGAELPKHECQNLSDHHYLRAMLAVDAVAKPTEGITKCSNWSKEDRNIRILKWMIAPAAAKQRKGVSRQERTQAPDPSRRSLLSLT